MIEYDDLDKYNVDTKHDIWVDCDNYENAGSSDVFDESDLDNYIENP